MSQGIFKTISDKLQPRTARNDSEKTSYGDQLYSNSRSQHSELDHTSEPKSQANMVSDQNSSAFQQMRYHPEFDEQINQIDLIEDYLILQTMDISQQMLFENQVRNIVNNFLMFLDQSYNKLFSDSVLMNLNVASASGGMTSDQSYLTVDDFKKTLRSMSESRFTLDVSYLALLVRSARGDDAVDEVLHDIKDEVNQVFRLITTRNFARCLVDPNYLIFHENEDDLKIDLSSGDELDASVMLPQTKQDGQKENTYLKNLFGGSDAFTNNELQDLLLQEKTLSKAQPQQTPVLEKTRTAIEIRDASSSNLSYESCKKLILQVELVIKNRKGEIVVREPI
jgi:hypothetical protein